MESSQRYVNPMSVTVMSYGSEMFNLPARLPSTFLPFVQTKMCLMSLVNLLVRTDVTLRRRRIIAEVDSASSTCLCTFKVLSLSSVLLNGPLRTSDTLFVSFSLRVLLKV